MTLPPTVATAIQEVRNAVATLSPDDQRRITYAVADLEPVIADELDKVAAAYLAKMPVFGPMADALVKNAIAAGLAEAESQLTAVKTSVGA